MQKDLNAVGLFSYITHKGHIARTFKHNNEGKCNMLVSRGCSVAFLMENFTLKTFFSITWVPLSFKIVEGYC